jgi:hypothetical protein
VSALGWASCNGSATAYKGPVDDTVKLFRRLHVDGQTGDDGMPAEPCDEQTQTAQKVVVLHLRSQVGMNRMEDTSRGGVLAEPVDEQDDDQEERGKEGDERGNREEVEWQQGGRCYDEEPDDLPSVRGKVTQESLERVSKQDDPSDGKGEEFAAESVPEPMFVMRSCLGVKLFARSRLTVHRPRA